MPAQLGHIVSSETRDKISKAHIMHGHRMAPRGSVERRTWNSWAQIRRRCLQPLDAAYSEYGGRGILIHPDWKEYINFLADMGLRPIGKTIDRIDNNGHYEKSNCKWSTKQEQARNRRSSKVLSISGEEKTLAEWAESSGLNSSTIRMRISRNGERVDSSILEPIIRK